MISSWPKWLFGATYGKPEYRLRVVAIECEAPVFTGPMCNAFELARMEDYGKAIYVARKIAELPLVFTITGNVVCEESRITTWEIKLPIVPNIKFFLGVDVKKLTLGEPIGQAVLRGMTGLPGDMPESGPLPLIFLGKPLEI